MRCQRTKSPYGLSTGKWSTVWEDEVGANIANLLFSNSTEIGCAIGKFTPVSQRTTQNGTMHFCQMQPPAESGEAPFE